MSGTSIPRRKTRSHFVAGPEARGAEEVKVATAGMEVMVATNPVAMAGTRGVVVMVATAAKVATGASAARDPACESK